jgi:hypothetical protein
MHRQGAPADPVGDSVTLSATTHTRELHDCLLERSAIHGRLEAELRQRMGWKSRLVSVENASQPWL